MIGMDGKRFLTSKEINLNEFLACILLRELTNSIKFLTGCLGWKDSYSTVFKYLQIL